MPILIMALVLLWPVPALATEHTCADVTVTVSAAQALEQDLICEAAVAAKSVLDSYGIVFPDQLNISTISKFDVDCVGVYHCGEQRIEILDIEVLDRVRSPKSIFAPLSTQQYFASIVLHEVLHAAYDHVDCPFEVCTVTSEYLAYAIQIDTLDPALRSEVIQNIDPETEVYRDELNVILLMMAPDTFGLKAWRHFSKRKDNIKFIAGIMDGMIVFDHFHP